MTIPSKRAVQRIERIHTSLGGFELLCSGTLSQRDDEVRQPQLPMRQ